MVEIRRINSDDIGECLKLSKAESWNQTGNDWLLLIDDPLNISLAAISENHIAGTATAINYEDDVAWIGMVLVDKSFRGHGISKILMGSLLEKLKSVRSVKLDATPAGKPVYEKFGFREECIIYRMTNRCYKVNRPLQYRKELKIIDSPVLNEVIDFDSPVFGAKRGNLINYLIKGCPDRSWYIKQDGEISGFALTRHGNKFNQIGPVYAINPGIATELISMALESLVGLPVVVDVPADKTELINLLHLEGFETQRHFVRMFLETNPLPGRREHQFLICGPEFG
jgi:GNAT superfamily N-acetyltransferase